MSSMFLGSDANIFLSLPVHRCFWSLWWWSWNRGWRAEAMDKQKRWGSFRVMQWTGCSTLFTVWWVKEDGLVFVVSQNVSMFRPVGLWVSRRWGIILFNIVSMLSMNLQLHEKKFIYTELGICHTLYFISFAGECHELSEWNKLYIISLTSKNAINCV